MDIRPFTQNDTQAWANLLAISFNRKQNEMCKLQTFLQSAAQLISFGAWDGNRLAAQYSCLLRQINIPEQHVEPALVGLSLNMAVHPDYRGQGLVKKVAAPVYEAVKSAGAIAGAGFSNAEGVKVDKKSKGYGYQVIGKMRPLWGYMFHRPKFNPLQLTSIYPKQKLSQPRQTQSIHFNNNSNWIFNRFEQHPFRSYFYGVCEEGIVVYRPLNWKGQLGASLLAVCGSDIDTLIGRWLSALWQSHARYVHVLTSPQSAVRTTLQKTITTLSPRLTRTPYYLTAKQLNDKPNQSLFDFAQWDCIGGDIL